MSLTDEQLDRYARHIVLKEIGGSGQRKLLDARVAIVGAGGIGAPVIQYLAAAGVGTLILIDDDRVSLSNLQRQTLFRTNDIGAFKVERSAAAVAALNPDVAVLTLAERLDATNAAALLEGADVIVDGSDNFDTRLTVSDAATRARVPLVSAAVGQFEGQLSVYRGWEPDLPCYRCLVGSDPGRTEASCAEAGVLGALTGVLGSLAAIEVVRAIAPFGDDPAGRLLLFDAASLSFRKIMVAKDLACPTCGSFA